MLILDTIVHETIWGGDRLSGYVKTGAQSIGHLYSVYCRAGISNTILNGEHKGKRLNEVFPLWKSEFGMEDCGYFPLTIALTEADADLSIQVHPDDAAASGIEGKPRGKRESWYFLEAPHSGRIVNGCRTKEKEECARAAAADDYGRIIDYLEVKPGDYVFVEPGTLHAITAGSLVYEIEEGADDTYRFYDYGRLDGSGQKRELHVGKALLALHPEYKSVIKRYGADGVIGEKTYTTKKLVHIRGYKNESAALECVTVIKGSFYYDGAAVSEGMTVMLWPGECLADAPIGLAIISTWKKV